MKILLIADSVSPYSSSGRVVHKISDILAKNGILIDILSYGSPDINTSLKVKYIKSKGVINNNLQHIIKGNKITETIEYIKECKPDIVHFASFNYARSKFILNFLFENEIRTILQPWNHDFYCAQVFGFRDGFACDACSNGDFFNAVKHNCSSKKKAVFGAISRYSLRTSTLNADIFISSNTYMDRILMSYGIPENRIKRLAIPFEKSIFEKRIFNKEENSSFIFYGQSKDSKGFYLMKDIAEKCPEIHFKLCPIGTSFDRTYFKGVKNIEVITTLSASNGLFEAINNARGVILPTLWPTTTEYSLYEAMYLSKPIIAFNVGAHIDLLKNKENAMVSPIGDLDDFVKNIREVAADANLRISLGKNARIFAELIADESNFYKQLMLIYND